MVSDGKPCVHLLCTRGSRIRPQTRARTTAVYYLGNDANQLREYAWYNANAGRATHPVGQLKLNAWGSYDMLGKVWEWCEDWYDASYYTQSPEQDPKDPDKGKSRVLRGGSWFNNRQAARVSNRNWNASGVRYGHLSFRCAQ